MAALLRVEKRKAGGAEGDLPVRNSGLSLRLLRTTLILADITLVLLSGMLLLQPQHQAWKTGLCVAGFAIAAWLGCLAVRLE